MLGVWLQIPLVRLLHSFRTASRFTCLWLQANLHNSNKM